MTIARTGCENEQLSTVPRDVRILNVGKFIGLRTKRRFTFYHCIYRWTTQIEGLKKNQKVLKNMLGARAPASTHSSAPQTEAQALKLLSYALKPDT